MWLGPGNGTFLEVASIVVTWWIVAFCAVIVSNWKASSEWQTETGVSHYKIWNVINMTWYNLRAQDGETETEVSHYEIWNVINMTLDKQTVMYFLFLYSMKLAGGSGGAAESAAGTTEKATAGKTGTGSVLVSTATERGPTCTCKQCQLGRAVCSSCAGKYTTKVFFG